MNNFQSQFNAAVVSEYKDMFLNEFKKHPEDVKEAKAFNPVAVAHSMISGVEVLYATQKEALKAYESIKDDEGMVSNIDITKLVTSSKFADNKINHALHLALALATAELLNIPYMETVELHRKASEIWMEIPF